METQNLEIKDKDRMDIDYMTIRKVVGIIAITLPIILLAGNLIFSNCNQLQNSISDYYYTVMGHYMVGALCAIALFLFYYKVYEGDNWLTNMSCLFALGAALFPTTYTDVWPDCNILTINSGFLVNFIHKICAVSFLLSLAYFSYFVFTKISGNPTPRKKQRNKVYKICGIIIVVSVICMALILIIPGLDEKLCPYKVIFILETIAVWAFGMSWIVKGQLILKDLEVTT